MTDPGRHDTVEPENENDRQDLSDSPPAHPPEDHDIDDIDREHYLDTIGG